LSKSAFVAVCAISAAALTGHIVGAQARSTADGVYADAQAKRGAELYAKDCASCHMADLTGNPVTPGLAGDEFFQRWQGKSVHELFDRIKTTMPALDPGSLTPAQTSDLVAYILSASKFPAGPMDLASEPAPLQEITIVAPTP
jgi:mono/diheme cytochrome c family protein